MPAGAHDKKLRRDLASLRLFNRASSATATPFLFAFVEVSFDEARSDQANCSQLRALLELDDYIFDSCIRYVKGNYEGGRKKEGTLSIDHPPEDLVVVLLVLMAKARRLETLALRSSLGIRDGVE